MESFHSDNTSYPNLKLQPLCDKSIQDFNNEIESIYELPFKLFPCPYQVVDIIGYSDDDFFHHLELFDSTERLNLMRILFNYCSELRKTPTLINRASSIHNKSESLQCTIEKLSQKLTENAKLEEIQTEISNCQFLSNFIEKYKIKNINQIDWMFVIIARFMKNHFDCYSTEQFLWRFCCEYFENDDLKTLSSSVKNDTKIEFEFGHENKFPYKLNVPINAQVSVIIDGVEFTECVEVSVLHFFYMCQPTDPDLIMKYWDEIDCPVREKVKDFFRLQGPKRANNKNPSIRKIWAEILSRIPGIIYRKKTDSSLPSNDVEIAAAWCNYVKAIAYLKNDRNVWNDLCKYSQILTEKNEIFPQIKNVVCESLAKLAGEKLQSIEWVENGPFEGIRFMDDGTSDLLGTVRCTFKGVPEKIDFIMEDGHGFIQWMNLYDEG